MLIESPIAILSLVDIVKGTIQMCKNSKFVLDGLIFGSDDYCASIGEHASQVFNSKCAYFIQPLIYNNLH